MDGALDDAENSSPEKLKANPIRCCHSDAGLAPSKNADKSRAEPTRNCISAGELARSSKSGNRPCAHALGAPAEIFDGPCKLAKCHEDKENTCNVNSHNFNLSGIVAHPDQRIKKQSACSIVAHCDQNIKKQDACTAHWLDVKGLVPVDMLPEDESCLNISHGHPRFADTGCSMLVSSGRRQTLHVWSVGQSNFLKSSGLQRIEIQKLLKKDSLWNVLSLPELRKEWEKSQVHGSGEIYEVERFENAATMNTSLCRCAAIPVRVDVEMAESPGAALEGFQAHHLGNVDTALQAMHHDSHFECLADKDQQSEVRMFSLARAVHGFQAHEVRAGVRASSDARTKADPQGMDFGKEQLDSHRSKQPHSHMLDSGREQHDLNADLNSLGSERATCNSSHEEVSGVQSEIHNNDCCPDAAKPSCPGFGPSCARNTAAKPWLKGKAARLRRGVVVRLHSLNDRSDLDGALGLCLGQKPDGRWAVQLDSEYGIFNLRQENLKVVSLGGATKANLPVRGQKRARAPSTKDVIEGIAALECETLRGCDPNERGSVRRKLLLKWHPDKAPTAAGKDLANNVMQALQNLPQWHA